MCSRQRKWQRSMNAEGKCCICAKPAVNKHHCEAHRDRQRELARNSYRRKHGIPLDAPKHSTYGGKPRASRIVNDSTPNPVVPNPEPAYRMLEVGETIWEGDEVASWSGEWGPMEAAGLVMIREWVGYYRRPVCRTNPSRTVTCDSRIPKLKPEQLTYKLQ